MKCWILILLISIGYCKEGEVKTMDHQNLLPNYVVINDESQSQEKRSILKNGCNKILFPLSIEDKKDIDTLEAKYESEENIAGLAAPQIGINKRIIIFAAPDSPELKKWRPDFTQAMEKTIWINPTYEGIEESGYHEDYEGCFSVHNLAGSVRRYKKIRYFAY